MGQAREQAIRIEVFFRHKSMVVGVDWLVGRPDLQSMR